MSISGRLHFLLKFELLLKLVLIDGDAPAYEPGCGSGRNEDTIVWQTLVIDTGRGMIILSLGLGLRIDIFICYRIEI